MGETGSQGLGKGMVSIVHSAIHVLNVTGEFLDPRIKKKQIYNMQRLFICSRHMKSRQMLLLGTGWSALGVENLSLSRSLMWDRTSTLFSV